MVPARALDIPVAWINRKREAAAGAAPAGPEFPTLDGLADWLAP